MKMKIQYIIIWRDAAKSVHKWQFITYSAYIDKEERSQNHYLIFYLRKTKINKLVKSKVNRRKELITNRL